jgi:hypothetical protein
MAQVLYTIPAGALSANLKKGYIPIPLGEWRILAAGVTTAIAVASGNGGQLALDTAPVLERVNGATDQKLRLRWIAGNAAVITADFEYPPDLDDTFDVDVQLLANMAGATDTPGISVAFFEGVGDTNAGGDTTNLSAAVSQKTRTVLAADIGAYPKGATISLTPGTHATDAMHLYGSWIEYTRKS